jgi:hypothetical protein
MTLGRAAGMPAEVDVGETVREVADMMLVGIG